MPERLEPSSNPNTTFIYALLDPRTKEIRYIGKADDPDDRLRKHISERNREKSHKSNWIKALLANGLCPIIEVVDEVLKTEWKAAESAYIVFYKEMGCRLVNGTSGGDGFGSGEDNPFFGKHLPAETRAKISAAGKGRKPSAETRLKLIAAQKRRPPPSALSRARMRAAQKLRKPITAEGRAKISATHKGKKFSSEHRAKIGAAQKGRQFSPEHRAKISAARKGTEQSTETIARRVAANTGKKRSDEARARMRVAQKNAWKRRRLKLEETASAIQLTMPLW